MPVGAGNSRVFEEEVATKHKEDADNAELDDDDGGVEIG